MSLTGSILLRGFGAVGAGGSAPDTPTLAVADNGDGTATATITTSSASSANVVWTREVSAATWTNSGNRTGDGTVELTLDPGYYHAVVISTLNSQSEASNVVYFRVTSSTTAVYDQILDAVRAEIVDLALTGVSASNVKRMKTPQALARNLPSTQFPCVIVCPWEQVTFGQGSNRRDDPVYPVLVALINAENADQSTNDDRTAKWAQDVRRRFHLPAQGTATDPFADIDEVFSSEVDPRPIYNLGDWSNNLGVTGFVIRVSAREVRTV